LCTEAISTVSRLADADDRPEFTETVGGQLEDRGLGLSGLVTEYQSRHGLLEPITAYGLLENARRSRVGLTRNDYVATMAALMAPALVPLS